MMWFVGAGTDWPQLAYYWFFLLALFVAISRVWDWRGNAVAGVALALAAALVMLALGASLERVLVMGAIIVVFTVVAGVALGRLLGPAGPVR